MNCFLELHLLAMDPFTSLQAEDIIYYPDPVITDGKPSPLQEEEEPGAWLLM